MALTPSFLIALGIVSIIVGTGIGLGVQITAAQFDFGPIPRAFIGGCIIVPAVFLKAIELGIVRLIPALLLIYYFSTFQIGTRIGHHCGITAPDDNDPPDEFFDMINRYTRQR